MFAALSRVKDAALEQGLAMALRPKLQRYGDLREIKIDTSARKVRGEILLLGDLEPLRITEASYRIESEAGAPVAVFYGVRVSKPWLQHILEDHVPEIKVKLPEFARKLLG